MTETLSVTEAIRNFSEVIDRVYLQGRTILLMRDGTIVAQISPPEKAATGADWLKRWEARPRLTPEEADAWLEELKELRSQVGPPTEREWDS